MIEDLGRHQGKTIAFGYDRHALPALEAYARMLAALGPIERAVDGARLHYLTSAERVCERLGRSPAAVGVLLCATGLGVCIAANKFRGVYAARCLSVADACASRAINNANVVCLALTSPFDVNRAVVEAFLATPYEGRKLDELIYLRHLEGDDVALGRLTSCP